MFNWSLKVIKYSHNFQEFFWARGWVPFKPPLSSGSSFWRVPPYGPAAGDHLDVRGLLCAAPGLVGLLVAQGHLRRDAPRALSAWTRKQSGPQKSPARLGNQEDLEDLEEICWYPFDHGFGFYPPSRHLIRLLLKLYKKKIISTIHVCLFQMFLVSLGVCVRMQEPQHGFEGDNRRVLRDGPLQMPNALNKCTALLPTIVDVKGACPENSP